VKISARPERTINPAWTERYEALRAHATGQAPLGFIPLGLALLQHRGVVAWMAAESSAVGSEPYRQAYPKRDRSSMDGVDTPRSELIRLLTGTALLTLRGRVQ
jgi:hypothetical protein